MRYPTLLASPDHFDRWDGAGEAERERAFAAYRAFSTAEPLGGFYVIDVPDLETAVEVRPTLEVDP